MKLRRPWSLWRSAGYGLLFMIALEALHWTEIVAESARYTTLDFVANLAGRLAVGPILFLIVALVRNLFAIRGNQVSKEIVDSISPAKPTKNKRRYGNFVARHWRGELPLWVSYWIVGFLGNVLVGLVAISVGSALATIQYQPLPIFGAVLGLWVTVVVIVLWQVVGVWRSANEYTNERSRFGKSTVWAGVAKFMVVLAGC